MRLRLSLALITCLSHNATYAFQCSTKPICNQIPEFVVCPGTNLADTSRNPWRSNVAGCYYPQSATPPPPLLPCPAQSDSERPVAPCWRRCDSDPPAHGLMQVWFPLLAARCNYTGYIARLMVRQGGCPADPAATDDFNEHSSKEVALRGCAPLDRCEDNQCAQSGWVLFRHVFSACYQLYLTPRLHNSAYANRELVSAPSYIDTGYSWAEATSMPAPQIFIDFKQSSLTLKLNLAMNPALSDLTLSHGIDTAAGRHACRDTGLPLSACTTCLASSEIKCNVLQTDMNIPYCSYQDSIVQCKFTGLKAGNYCVRIQYHDERCKMATVFREVNNYTSPDPCTWEISQQYYPADGEKVLPMLESRNDVSPFVLSILILVVIVTCGLVGMVVYRRLSQSYPRFMPEPHKPIRLPERPVILLLYARDCPQFMQAVAELRTLMRRAYNCQVVDCWEESQYESLARGPARWVMSQLASSCVRVVLVTSPACAAHEAAIVHSAALPQYRQPRAFDSLLHHALTALHESNASDSYSRLFIVRLDSEVEGSGPKVKRFLNPLTTYVLPFHLNRLIATLHNLDTSACLIAPECQSDSASLADAITEYQRFLRDNPRYLDGLFANTAALQTLMV